MRRVANDLAGLAAFHALGTSGFLAAALAVAPVVTAAPAAAQAPAARAVAVFDSAYQAWDAGDYDVALQRLLRVLDAPGSDDLLDDVAVLTGERYRTVEVAPDGTGPRWSPDGRHALYEVPTRDPASGSAAGATSAGAGAEGPTTVVVTVARRGGGAVGGDGGGGKGGPGPRAVVREVARLRGHGAVFSPDGARVAWLRTVDPAALAREEARIREEIPGRDRESRIRQRQALADARARHARVRVRDLAGGRERDVPAREPVTAVTWRDGAAVPWLADPGVTMSPTGTHLVFRDDEGLGLLTLATGWQRTFAGSDAPAFSADGSTFAFITRDDGEGDEPVVYALRRLRLDGPGADARLPETVLVTTDRLDAPALSGDGSVVAFQRMGRDNWEVWVAGAGGGEGAGAEFQEVSGDGAGATVGKPAPPRRLTHDVQHDLMPAFLAGDRLLVIKGEARHRRSYVYPTTPPDAAPAGPAGPDAPPSAPPAIREWVPGSGEGMRLFHNNTVRTVAPEYEWAVSPDGTMILIVAERDGDTITPDRGVYLVDLGAPVTRDELRARVREQLDAETALRQNARRIFAGIEDDVRTATADVSVARVRRYAEDLARFDTKYIGTPGNRQAIDYLVARLKGWGYEPELQWFGPRPGIRSANVIARLRGTERPEETIVVSAHFDSVERGPGADDNSSGTTALLEAARVLASRPRPATVEFAWFTGEEAGLLGSREYARRAAAEGKRVVVALNNDMLGYANDDRLDDTIRYSSAKVRDLQHAAALLFTHLILYDAHYYKSTDAHALYDAFGDVVGGIGSYPILANPHYHQAHDVLETIDQRLVAEVAKAVVATVMGVGRP